MSKQESLMKMLVSDFGFNFKDTRTGALGKRFILTHLFGLEASISLYRVCFYAGQAAENQEQIPFPDKNHPCCFDVDKKGEITAYLQKNLGWTAPKKARRRAPQTI